VVAVTSQMIQLVFQLRLFDYSRGIYSDVTLPYLTFDYSHSVSWRSQTKDRVLVLVLRYLNLLNNLLTQMVE